NRNAISTTHRLHGCGNAGECHHQRACEIAANLIDLCHVPGGYDEHMAPVTGLLMTAREHRGVAVAQCENFRREITTHDPTERARYRCLRAHRFHRASAPVRRCCLSLSDSNLSG